jgi:hypothetical protein
MALKDELETIIRVHTEGFERTKAEIKSTQQSLDSLHGKTVPINIVQTGKYPIGVGTRFGSAGRATYDLVQQITAEEQRVLEMIRPSKAQIASQLSAPILAGTPTILRKGAPGLIAPMIAEMEQAEKAMTNFSNVVNSGFMQSATAMEQFSKNVTASTETIGQLEQKASAAAAAAMGIGLPPTTIGQLASASQAAKQVSNNMTNISTSATVAASSFETINKKFATNMIRKELTGLQRQLVLTGDVTGDIGNKIASLRTRFIDLGLGGSKSFDALIEKSQKLGKNATFLHRTFERMGRTIVAFFGVTAIFGGAGLFVRAIAEGIKFNETLERAKLGIASILTSQGEFTDATNRSVQGYTKLIAAQQLSGNVIRQLQKDNLETMATLEQLVTAYQQAAAFGLSKGYSPEQIRQYTVAMVQAGGAIGIQLDRMAEEVRSLMTGVIRPGQSLIAGVLGITSADYQKYKSDAAGWFNFIMDKLEAFREAGVESQKTFAGLISNLKDAFSIALGEGLEPFFEYAKSEMFGLQRNLVRWNDVTKKMEVNPNFIEGMKEVNNQLIGTIELIKDLCRLIANIPGMDFLSITLGAVSSILAYVIKKSADAEEELNNLITKGQMLKKEQWAGAPPLREPYKIDLPRWLKELNVKIMGYLDPQAAKEFDEFMSDLQKKGQLRITPVLDTSAINKDQFINTLLEQLDISSNLKDITEEQVKAIYEGLSSGQKKEIEKLSNVFVTEQKRLAEQDISTKPGGMFSTKSIDEYTKKLNTLRDSMLAWLGLLQYKITSKPTEAKESEINKQQAAIDKLIIATGHLSEENKKDVEELLKKPELLEKFNQLLLSQKVSIIDIIQSNKDLLDIGDQTLAQKIKELELIRVKQILSDSELQNQNEILKVWENIDEQLGLTKLKAESTAKIFENMANMQAPKFDRPKGLSNLEFIDQKLKSIKQNTNTETEVTKSERAVDDLRSKYADMTGDIEEQIRLLYKSLETDNIKLQIYTDLVNKQNQLALLQEMVAKAGPTASPEEKAITAEMTKRIELLEDEVQKLQKLSDQFDKTAKDVVDFEAAQKRASEASNIADLNYQLQQLVGSWEDVKNAEIEAVKVKAEIDKLGKDEKQKKLIDQITAANVSYLQAQKDLNFQILAEHGLIQTSLKFNQELADQYENLIPNAISTTTDAFQAFLEDLQKGTEKPFTKLLDNLRTGLNQIFTDIFKTKIKQVVIDVAKGGNIFEAIMGKNKNLLDIFGLGQKGINEVKLEGGCVPVVVKNWKTEVGATTSFGVGGAWGRTTEYPDIIGKLLEEANLHRMTTNWKYPSGTKSPLGNMEGISGITGEMGNIASNIPGGGGVGNILGNISNIFGSFASIAKILPELSKFWSWLTGLFGLIAFHEGGEIRLHKGGVGKLRPGEVLRILEVGEIVTRKESVNSETKPMLDYINAYGKVPYRPDNFRMHNGGSTSLAFKPDTAGVRASIKGTIPQKPAVVNVTLNIATPDASSFRRSERQIRDEVMRGIKEGIR